MKLAVLVTILALGSVAATSNTAEEGEYYYEWEYYEAEAVVDPIPSDESYEVSIEEEVTQIVDVDVEYIEYEYRVEYEYEGALNDGGDMNGGKVDPDAPCVIHFVRDCDDNCAPAYWIGNGLCDHGGLRSAEKGATGFPFVNLDGITYMPDTNPDNLNKFGAERNADEINAYNFNCDAFWNDGGDCENKDAAIEDGYTTFLNSALSLQIGEHQIGMPTLAIAVLAVVAVVGAVMKR